MKIEIKVTATDLTPADSDIAKTYCSVLEKPDRTKISCVERLSEIEDRILEAIFARIRHDRANLLEWVEDSESIGARIEIIPAVDYIPD